MSRFLNSQRLPSRAHYVVLLLVTALSHGHAAIITVTDSIDSNPGVIDGTCTLREALIAANRNLVVDACASGQPLPIIDEIRFSAAIDDDPIVLTRTGADENEAQTGDLDVLESVRIVGNGGINPGLYGSGARSARTLIDGNSADRVLHVPVAEVDLTLANLAVTGGANVEVGAGIRFVGETLHTMDVLIYGNRADRVIEFGNYFGGGVSAAGNVLLERTAIFDNHIVSSKTSPPEAIDTGGGISVSGRVIIRESVIAANTVFSVRTGFGGGIYLRGAASITDSLIADNRTEDSSFAEGGGLSVNFSTTISLVRSAIIRNTAGAGPGGSARGGGIYVRSASPGVLIFDSTIAQNVAVGGSGGSARGGGILATGNGIVRMRNATVVSNEARGPSNALIGGIWPEPNDLAGAGAIEMSNSILAQNRDDGFNPDCGNANLITSFDYNLIGNNAGCDVVNGGHDQIGTNARPIDPQVLFLEDSGGFVRIGDGVISLPSYAPLSSPLSPAIDGANPSAAGSNSSACSRYDQRGNVRSVDGDGDGDARCDIGAYESGASPDSGLIFFDGLGDF